MGYVKALICLKGRVLFKEANDSRTRQTDHVPMMPTSELSPRLSRNKSKISISTLFDL